MLKIKYGIDSLETKILETKYLTYFDLTSFQSNLDALFKRNSKLHKIKIEDILLGSLASLLKMSSDVEPKNINRLKQIFNYDYTGKTKYRCKQQPSIAKFFADNENSINLNTCYYCNIDYINIFNDLAQFIDVDDLYCNAAIDDFCRIEGIGPQTAKLIVQQRNNSIKINDLPIERNQLANLKGLVVKKKHSHFTLDHVLDKANNPIAALSLYNFVPCCYSCNSKFKRSQLLVTSPLDIFLSPSSESFNFHKDVSFKILPSPKLTHFNGISTLTDFSIGFSIFRNEVHYKHYIKMFRLKERYSFHKKEVLKLIEKRKKYSDTQIAEIAKITKQSTVEVKKNLFGEDLFDNDLTLNSLSKLKMDTLKHVGLK